MFSKLALTFYLQAAFLILHQCRSKFFPFLRILDFHPVDRTIVWSIAKKLWLFIGLPAHLCIDAYILIDIIPATGLTWL